MRAIVLIGMPASGKTTIGKNLAKKYNLNFIDIDSEIEKNERKTITEIFAQNSEEYFRAIETKIIQTSINQNTIVSTGGGAFENPHTRDLLLKTCNVIYLEASPQTIYLRSKNNNDRPLLQGDIKQKIQELLKKREKNYKLAHIKISTDNKTVEQITDEIWQCVNLM